MKKKLKQTPEGEARVVFTKEMRRDYTIFIPTMLPRHFKIIASLMQIYGYKTVLLENDGPEVIENGLRYVHNDTCYPALLVIGQFIDAIKNGGYDPHKVALLFTQTGGGCRASNYISLLRKALAKAGYGFVPVISLNFVGLEANPGFRMTLPLLMGGIYAVFYGDLIQLLVNQCKPYEIHEGDAERLADEWTERLVAQLGAKRRVPYRTIKKTYREIVRSFQAIPRTSEKKVKVGIVGEIFVKFSPLANRNLEDYLISEGAEPRLAGLSDFVTFYVYNSIAEYQINRRKKGVYHVMRFVYSVLKKKREDLNEAIRAESEFDGFADFDKVVADVKEVISLGVKMGEGWLLPGEMLELIHSGVENVICAQPFGCLPNHIVGKGVMKPIKELHPTANIIAVDYDASATAINQQNRIKLLLANARERLEEKTAEKEKDPACV